MSPASRAAIVLAAFGVLAVACGDEEPSAATDPAPTSLPSLAEWCARFQEDLPALASPNPDGQELELLDLHIARARQVAAGAPGVTEAAMAAAGEVERVHVAIRERVADGEPLPDVLTELWSADTAEVVEAARVLDTEAETLC